MIYYDHSPLRMEVRARSQGRSLEAGTLAEVVEEWYWMAWCPWFSQSYNLYNLGPREDTTHTDLGSPISIINQESPRKHSTILLIANLMEAFSQFMFIFPCNSSFTVLTKTKHRHSDDFIDYFFNCWNTKRKGGREKQKEICQ